MERRNVITDLNPDWVIGFVHERPDENSEWQQALHSEWVFARIGPNIGERHSDDAERFSLPQWKRFGLIVGDPGQTVNQMMDMVRMMDQIAIQAGEKLA